MPPTPLRHLCAAVLLLLPLLVAATGCKGQQAIEELEAIRDKTCSCDGDVACLDEAKAMVADWLEAHRNTRGDQERAGEIAVEIRECSPAVAREFAADE